MAVLTALKRTPGSLLRNPVLFVPLVAIMFLQAPSFAAEWLDPLYAVIISLALSGVFLFVMPFFQGGLIGMADEALRGRTSLERFLEAGRSNYVSIFGAYLALVGINIAFAIGAILLFGVGVLGVSLGVGAPTGPVAVIPALLLALVFLAYLLVAFFVQFYGHAIVLSGHGAIDGLKHSVGIVRRHLASTLGYSLLAVVIGGGVGLVAGVVSVLTSPRLYESLSRGPPPVEWLVGFVAVVGILSVVLGAFLGVFSVAFYREITSRDAAPTPSPDPS